MTLRERIYAKYNGKCAYTGKPLEPDWQIDHAIPKERYVWYQSKATKLKLGVDFDMNDDRNLLPALRIVNHYKRSLDVEQFRKYMKSFHLRLAKLPKTTRVKKSAKRKEYMFKVAEAFDITVDKPFNGIFYFEKEETK